MDAPEHKLEASAEVGEAGISGQVSIALPDPDAAAPCARERKSDRVSVAMHAGLRQRGAAAVSVQILDLSIDGFRIDTHLDLPVGTDVWLRLPGLEPHLAHVAWSDGFRAGCAFDRPLHPAVLDMIVQRAGRG